MSFSHSGREVDGTCRVETCRDSTDLGTDPGFAKVHVHGLAPSRADRIVRWDLGGGFERRAGNAFGLLSISSVLSATVRGANLLADAINRLPGPHTGGGKQGG